MLEENAMNYTKSILSIGALVMISSALAVAMDLRLHYAATLGNAQRVKELLKEGVDPNGRDTNGKTALHCAVGWGGTPKVIRLLVEAGADVNARDAQGNAPLREAATWGSLKLVRALLEAGAIVDESVVEESRSHEIRRLLIRYYDKQHANTQD